MNVRMLIAILMFVVVTPAVSNGEDLSVTKDQYANAADIHVTNISDSAVHIVRVIVNRRINNPDCDSEAFKNAPVSGPGAPIVGMVGALNLPQTLNYGDSAIFGTFTGMCGTVLEVKVYWDKYVETFRFSP